MRTKAIDTPLPREKEHAITRPLPAWAETLTRWLDGSAIRIPGTEITIGLDAILGLILPGVGDVVTGTGSVSLLLLALKERVPTVVLLRMVMNIAIDTLGGVLPIVGDAFDLFFRSNRRNLDLIEKHRGGTEAPSASDYAVVGLGLTLAVASVVVPIFLVYGLGFSLIAWLTSMSS